jgi:hypothetical protein
MWCALFFCVCEVGPVVGDFGNGKRRTRVWSASVQLALRGYGIGRERNVTSGSR